MQKPLFDRVARSLLLIACGLGASPRASAEVRIIVGTAAGRTAKAGDPAIVNEPFAVSFDTKGRMYGVEAAIGIHAEGPDALTLVFRDGERAPVG